jgi:hypothetical protein
VIAYSIYSKLPSISGGHLLHPQPEDAPYSSDPLNMDNSGTEYTKFLGKTELPAGF